MATTQRHVGYDIYQSEIGHPFALVIKQNGYIQWNPSLTGRASTYTLGVHFDTLKVGTT